ncbi:MAG: hypothetical protein HZB18_02880 [Chloroflexi bacterium]|nr:hypothetical protein [Chloroflexota bacterium]
MKKILFLILTAFLTACSSSSSQVTVTSEVTVTLPPTTTPLPTLTLTLIPASPTPEQPTETGPSPEQIATIEAHNEAWNGVLSINEENQFLNKAGEVVTGLVYDPATGMIRITRADAAGHDFTEQFDPKLIVVETDDDGVIDETINYVFSLGENGQLERLKYGETSEYLYTQDEVLQMVAENHSTAPGADLDTLAHGKEILSNFQVKDATGTTWYIKFGDFYEEQGSVGGSFFGTNKVKIWNSETQKEEVIDTSEYVGVGFGGKDGDSSYAVIVWIGADGKPNIKIVHGSKKTNHSSGWWGITE